MRRMSLLLAWVTLLVPTYTAAFPFPKPAIIREGMVGCNFSGPTGGIIAAECIPSVLTNIIELIFSLIGGFFILMVIIAGYQIALAKATGRDRSEGLTRLRVAIIGFILCTFSWYMLDFIIRSLAGI